ncbi:MAG TPA: hypothetical protein VMW69_11090 [Spirochaetia bacterium]|nr:hypothetical protein [Spirochaetia bacterium]
MRTAVGALRILVVCGMLTFVAGIAAGEVFNPPALRPTEPFGQTAFIPAASAVIEASHFVPTSRSLFHNYHFQTTALVTLYRADRFALSGSSVLLFEMQRDPSNQWYFWASAILTNLSLEAHLKLGAMTAILSYDHGCEHDLDTFRGRQPISDSLTAGLTPIRSDTLTVTARLRYYLPPVFQGYAPLADVGAGILSFDWQPLHLGPSAVLFLQGNLDGILQRGGSLASDWMVRAGIVTPSHSRGIALYGELQHLSDDWVSPAPTPVTLVSFGVAIGA